MKKKKIGAKFYLIYLILLAFSSCTVSALLCFGDLNLVSKILSFIGLYCFGISFFISFYCYIKKSIKEEQNKGD